MIFDNPAEQLKSLFLSDLNNNSSQNNLFAHYIYTSFSNITTITYNPVCTSITRHNKMSLI